MVRTLRSLILLLAVAGTASGQARLRRLPSNLNHPAINNYAPYISLDGNSIVYISDLGEDHDLVLTYTSREGVNWKDPLILPRAIGHKLNFLRGCSLSPDGKTLYLSNMKSNGMGGFDLYASQWKGTRWEEPVNMLLPANSKENEACASLSLDGNSFYYMRCATMDVNKASGCRILVMRKKTNGQWDNPEELPGYINTGNSQAPRIMGDGEMLIFSSDQLQPNRGGMDLYFTRWANGSWSKPQPLDFANTPENDQYVSASAAGMYLLKEASGQRSSELIEMLFPPEVRPTGTMRLEGSVSGIPDPALSYVTAYRTEDQSKVSTTQPAKDGSFLLYLNHGARYQLVIEPADEHYTFATKEYDLRSEDNPMVERLAVSLELVAPGTVLDAPGIGFNPSTATLTSASALELSRFNRLIEGNPDRSFSVEVTLYGYKEDSVRSDPDLTEVVYDTTRIPVTYRLDSVTTETRDSIVVRPRYHNDRTLQQAQAVVAALIREGTKPGRLAGSGKAIVEAIPEKRKTLIQIIVH